MDPYVLEFKDPEDDQAVKEGAVGYCYAKHLATSKWAGFWGDRQRSHFVRNLGLSLMAEIDGMTLWLNANREVFVLLFPYGVSMELPDLAALEKGESFENFRWVNRTRELNLHDLPGAIASDVKTALEKNGTYSMYTLAEQLGVVDCFLNPKALAASQLVFDEELKNYWMGNSISVMSTYQVAVPQTIVDAVKNSRR